MKRICAWCKKYMGSTPGGIGITHGICPACLKKLEAASNGQGGSGISTSFARSLPTFLTEKEDENLGGLGRREI